MKKMNNEEVLAKLDFEGGWAALASWGLKPKNISDPILRDKWMEYLEAYNVLMEIEDELDRIAEDVSEDE